MTFDNSNRFRVSTKFTLLKVVIGVSFIFILADLTREINNDTFSSESVTGLTGGTLFLIALTYFIRTRKIIEYDNVKQTLYVFTSKGQLEVEIPVERIDKILYSAVGLNWMNSSYVIVYRDFHNQKQKVRLFPIPLNNNIDTIITDTKLKNPALVTRSWSIGLNEFFD